MALFSNNDEISEELLKKSMNATASAQEVVVNANAGEALDPEQDINNKHSLAYLEANGIKANDAIDILGDKDTFVARLKDFDSLAKSKYGNLMECKATMNIEKYCEESDELKEACNYLGIEKLFIMAKNHKQKAKVKDTEFILNNFKEYEDEIMRVTNLIEEYLA